MGLAKTEKELNNLDLSSLLPGLFIIVCTQFCTEISLILVSQKLFERKLVAHFLLDNSSKGFFRKGFDAGHWWEIYLFVFLTRSVLAACFVGITYGNLKRLSFLSLRT